jgi:uncharacterized protein (TIGR02246 family)
METTQSAGTQGQAVDSSLDATLQKFTEAFNRYDRKAVAAHWAEDGTLITPSGEVGKGRAGVEKVYGHDVDTILTGSKSRFTITSARRLSPELVFLDLDHDVQNFKMPDGSQATMKLHLVILAKKSGSVWQFLDARPYAFLPTPPSVH